MNDRIEDQEDLPDDTPVVEWVLAAISVILFASGLTYLAAHGVTAGDGPVELRIVHSLSPTDPRRVDFVLVNMGEKTAAQVQVKGQVLENGAVAEESRAVIDYAPEGSSEQGSLLFFRDVRGLEFRVTAEGFNEP